MGYRSGKSLAFPRITDGADGKLYVQNHAGTVHVIDAKSGKVLHKTNMGDPGDDQTRATIAVAHEPVHPHERPPLLHRQLIETDFFYALPREGFFISPG